MDPSAASTSSSAAEAGPPLCILFFLWAINFDRIFECFLRELLERGHELRILFVEDKRRLPRGAGESLRALAATHATLSWGFLPPRRGRELDVAIGIRSTLDYLRYLGPEYAHAEALRERARVRVPVPLRHLLGRIVARSAAVRGVVRRSLEALEACIPVPVNLVETVRAVDPDLVMVAPLLALGSSQVDLLRAASAAGVPTALPVASWDNLTNKGLMQERPGLTIVWNEHQVDEAVRLHGLPRDRVVAVGAHAWDHWFDWRPSTDRDAFCERAGLEPGTPYLLYVCSSAFIAPEEPAFVADWLRHLRAADDPRLRGIGVIVRPHPQNTAVWEDADVCEPGRVVLWPREGATPTDDARKADYYDSLWYASGVVGINTSALIESAIVRRPVFTLLDDRFRDTQGGTLHFAHLVGTSDEPALLNVAATWDEHLEQLSAAIDDPGRYEARIEEFLRTFVRPHGLATPAAPLAADAVQWAATLPAAAPRQPGMVASLALRLGSGLLLSPAGAAAARKRRARAWDRARRGLRRERHRLARLWLSRLRRLVRSSRT